MPASRLAFVLLAAMTVIACGVAASAAQIVRPTKDGTLADGSPYGPFDGFSDDEDWYFNESGYEGSINLITVDPDSSLEYRVVWEYNLAAVSIDPPVSAMLNFTVRGAPIWPFPDVDVHVYSYPSDLLETPADFHAGPAVLEGFVTISPYQPPTDYTLDVSEVVTAALLSGQDRVAFRFQVDPDTENIRNQAFIDALDSEPETKPFLVIDEPIIPGDADGDGDVDFADYLALEACLHGPDVTVTGDCTTFQLDARRQQPRADQRRPGAGPRSHRQRI